MGVPAPKPDPVLHLRIASIYFAQAQRSGFREPDIVERALKQYKLSLLVVPTAEAWRNAGICAYMRARLMERNVEKGGPRQTLLQEALRYLAEATSLTNVDRKLMRGW